MSARLAWAAAPGLLAMAAATEAAGQDTPVALVGARIHTAAGPALENGTIVFRDGVITALGQEEAGGAERADDGVV